MSCHLRQFARRAAHQVLLQVGVIAANGQGQVLEIEIRPTRQSIDQYFAGCVHDAGILPAGDDFVY